MTSTAVPLPVTAGVVAASLAATIMMCLSRYPGLRRHEIEDDRAVAAILARAPTQTRAKTWMAASMTGLVQRRAIEKRKGQHGWFLTEQQRT